jgi:hypothetical protein
MTIWNSTKNQFSWFKNPKKWRHSDAHVKKGTPIEEVHHESEKSWNDIQHVTFEPQALSRQQSNACRNRELSFLVISNAISAEPPFFQKGRWVLNWCSSATRDVPIYRRHFQGGGGKKTNTSDRKRRLEIPHSTLVGSNKQLAMLKYYASI